MLQIIQSSIDRLSFDFNHYLAYLLLSISWWITIYGIVRYCFRNKNPEWCCRIVSFIHGCIAATLGIQQCLRNPNPFSDRNFISSNEQKIILIISAGYFIHDLVWCLVYRTESQLMLIHHSFSVYALVRMAWRVTSAGQACCGLGGAESTNPLLQIRWFIRSAGYRHTKLFVITEVTFSLLFFIVRIIFGTIIMISINADWEMWGICLFIYMVSWLFMINILVYIRKRFFFNETEGTVNSTYLVEVDS